MITYFYITSAFALGISVGWYLSLCYWEKRVKRAVEQLAELDLWYQAAVDEIGILKDENERLQGAVDDLGMTLAEYRARHKVISDDEPIYGDEIVV